MNLAILIFWGYYRIYDRNVKCINDIELFFFHTEDVERCCDNLV